MVSTGQGSEIPDGLVRVSEWVGHHEVWLYPLLAVLAVSLLVWCRLRHKQLRSGCRYCTGAVVSGV